MGSIGEALAYDTLPSQWDRRDTEAEEDELQDFDDRIKDEHIGILRVREISDEITERAVPEDETLRDAAKRVSGKIPLRRSEEN